MSSRLKKNKALKEVANELSPEIMSRLISAVRMELEESRGIERAMPASMTSAPPQTVTFLENVHNNLNGHCARLHEALLVMRQFNTERLGSLPPPAQDAQKTPEPSCATSRIWKILDDASSLMTQLETEIKRAQEL